MAENDNSGIKRIQAEDLRRMDGREGLILQGCGGPPQEWVDEINKMLANDGILVNGSQFRKVSIFEHDGVTNILFDFEGTELNIGKFAIWRLQTHPLFHGTWLSDYVPNRLGGFVRDQAFEKPDCPLIGEDGNIFNLMGIAAKTLRAHGLKEQAKEMQTRIYCDCHDYNAALNVIGEYVNITDRNEQEHASEMTWGGL